MAYISYAAAVFPILFGIYVLFQKSPSSPSHDALPIVGLPPHIFGRLVAAIRYLLHADDLFKEGYRKYPSGFRVPVLFSPDIVVLPASLTKEVKDAAETDLSAVSALDTEFGFDKALYSPLINSRPFHIPILRGILTQRLGDLLYEIEEEVGLAFEEEWGPAIRGEWTEIDAYTMGMKITSRSSQRILMGLPLCKSYVSRSLIPCSLG